MSYNNYTHLPPYCGSDQEGIKNDNILGEQNWPPSDQLSRHNRNSLPDHPILNASSAVQPPPNFKPKPSNLNNGDETMFMKRSCLPESGLFMNAEEVETKLMPVLIDRPCYGLLPPHDERAIRNHLLHLALHNNESSNVECMSDVPLIQLFNTKVAGPVLEADWRRLENNDIGVSVRNAAQHETSFHLSSVDSGVVRSGSVDEQTSLTSINTMDTGSLPGNIPLDQDPHSQIDADKENVIASAQQESSGSSESYSRELGRYDANDYASISDVMDRLNENGSHHGESTNDSDEESLITINSDTGRSSDGTRIHNN